MKEITFLKSTFLSFITLFSIVGMFSCSSQEERQNQNLIFDYAIPAEGNAWAVDNGAKNSELVKKGGISGWDTKETVFRTYFKSIKLIKKPSLKGS